MAKQLNWLDTKSINEEIEGTYQLQKKKIIAVVLAVAVIIAAIVGYEFFVVNSLSGYTKVSLTYAQTYSIKFGNTVQYNITFLLNPFPNPNVNGGGSISQNSWLQVSIDNISKVFEPIQGDKYSFSGLQIVVGSVNSSQLILYVKPNYNLRGNNFFCSLILHHIKRQKSAREQNLTHILLILKIESASKSLVRKNYNFNF